MFNENENKDNVIEEVIEAIEEVKEEEPQFTNDFAFEEKVKPVKEKKKSGFFKKVVAVAVCAFVAGGVFNFSLELTDELAENVADKIGTTQDALNSDKRAEAALLSYSEFAGDDGVMSIESITEACLPSVVAITNKGVSEVMTFFGNYQMESESSGSGIIIGKNDSELLIVTNYHVVADSKELTVVFSHDEKMAKEDDEAYINPALIKGYDAQKDIAVIAVKLTDISEDAMGKIKIATIGNSDDIKLGSGVVAIGNSLGHGQSVTHGIVSALDREVELQSVSGNGTIVNQYIQTDAAINSGNSGGALLNMKGELIGINSAKVAASGVEGMGYAIPISDVEELINNLMSLKTRDVVDEEKRGYLGILGTDVTYDVSQIYGMPVGVFVKEISVDKEKTPIEEGDIIVAVDDVSISGMSDLQARLSYYEKGETVKLTVKRVNGRQYESVDLEVTLFDKSAIED